MIEINRLREETRKIRREVKKQTVGYILAALGLVAGLAWNEAIRALIEQFFPGKNSIEAKFLYAAVITIVVVVIGIYLARLSQEDQQQK